MSLAHVENGLYQGAHAKSSESLYPSSAFSAGIGNGFFPGELSQLSPCERSFKAENGSCSLQSSSLWWRMMSLL